MQFSPIASVDHHTQPVVQRPTQGRRRAAPIGSGLLTFALVLLVAVDIAPALDFEPPPATVQLPVLPPPPAKPARPPIPTPAPVRGTTFGHDRATGVAATQADQVEAPDTRLPVGDYRQTMEWFRIAMGNYNAGQFALAEPFFGKVVERYPRMMLPRWYYAVCRMRQGDLGTAALHAQFLVQNWPSDPRCRELLATIDAIATGRVAASGQIAGGMSPVGARPPWWWMQHAEGRSADRFQVPVHAGPPADVGATEPPRSDNPYRAALSIPSPPRENLAPEATAPSAPGKAPVPLPGEPVPTGPAVMLTPTPGLAPGFARPPAPAAVPPTLPPTLPPFPAPMAPGPIVEAAPDTETGEGNHP